MRAVRHRGAQLSPFVALSSPLDDGAFGEIVTVTAGVGVGFEGAPR